MIRGGEREKRNNLAYIVYYTISRLNHYLGRVSRIGAAPVLV